MPQGKGFCQPEGTRVPSKEQLKRWSQMLAQRFSMNQSVADTNKDITNEYIKETYGS